VPYAAAVDKDKAREGTLFALRNCKRTHGLSLLPPASKTAKELITC
jgi:hypothetical protein